VAGFGHRDAAILKKLLKISPIFNLEKYIGVYIGVLTVEYGFFKAFLIMQIRLFN